MKNTILIFTLLILPVMVSAQEEETPICTMTPVVELENNADPNIKKVFECWSAYLASKPDSIYDNPYWNTADKQKYVSYDLLKSEAFLSPGLYAFKLKNLVISITQMGDGYQIRSIFYHVSPTDGLYVMAITNVMAEQDEKGAFKLHNWLTHHTRSWNKRKVGLIDYCYYPEYPFNLYEAEKANKLISDFKDKLDIQVDRVEYYIAENCDDIMRLKGFDYVVGMGNHFTNLCGFCDTYNNLIYSNSKMGECYEHELTRLINNFFPKAHGLFLNGLSEYFNEDGIQIGLPHIEHLKRMDDHLKQNKSIDLKDLSSFYRMDNVTSPHYMLGMIICQLTIEKGGLDLLKKGLNYGSSDEDIYRFLDEELGIKRENMNKKFRELISHYSQKGIKRIGL